MSVSHEITSETIAHNIHDDTVTHDVIVESITHEIGNEQGPPGPPGTGANPADFSRDYQQVSAQAIWDIAHNLGFKPNIQIVDSGGDSVLPFKIEHDGINRSLVYFGGAMSGNAYLS